MNGTQAMETIWEPRLAPRYSKSAKHTEQLWDLARAYVKGEMSQEDVEDYELYFKSDTVCRLVELELRVDKLELGNAAVSQ